jgi:hypothetical protein
MELNCVFSHPLNSSSTVPEIGDFWQYSEMDCDLPFLSSFSDGTTTSYYSNTITSFDVILIFFLLLILVFGIIKIIWDFFLR